MKIRNVIVAVFVVAVGLCAASVEAQTITCTDATATNCTVKKNQPFQLTNDPANPADAIQTEKWRLYVNGAPVQELANAGVSPVWNFGVGLAATGDHTFYVEALGHDFNAQGQWVEVISGPSNSVKLSVVTGSLTAPKNLRPIIK